MENSWDIIKRPEHSPPYAEEYLTQTTKGLLVLAKELGEHIHEIAIRIAEDKAVDALRPIRSLLGLAHKYSVPRCEAACRRALDFEICGYINVKNILMQKLDSIPFQVPSTEIKSLAIEEQSFRFAREYGYFSKTAEAATFQTTGGLP